MVGIELHLRDGPAYLVAFGVFVAIVPVVWRVVRGVHVHVHHHREDDK